MDNEINHRGHRELLRAKRKGPRAMCERLPRHDVRFALCAWPLAVALLCVLSGSNTGAQNTTPLSHSINPEPGEKHLRNIRQLTFGGENAEAYFSADGKKLIFQ